MIELWMVGLFGVLIGAIAMRLLCLKEAEGPISGSTTYFYTLDSGVHWACNGYDLAASHGTDKLQDAYDYLFPRECTRKAKHHGPCNGYPAGTCREASKAGYQATLRQS